MENQIKIQSKLITNGLKELFLAVGLSEFSVNAVVDGLVRASLRGIDSHGIRLVPHYVESGLRGRKNPNPNFKITQKYNTILAIDADGAYGHAAGYFAIDEGIKIADKFGMAAVSVFNSSHCGAMSSMALKATEKGYLCFAFTHADSLMQTTNSSRSYFGTNPICFTAPRKNKLPFCLDMATTIIPWNKVKLSRENKINLMERTAVDSYGVITNNPNDAVALLPIGDYKGFGLAAMVEVLCGVYSGMSFGREIPSMYMTDMRERRNLSQFYLIMKTDGVIQSSEFEYRLTKMTEEIQSEPKLSSAKPVLPGDKEEEIEKERLINGIPMSLQLIEEINRHALNLLNKKIL